ncbi:11615_t:CDS:10 [Funneliformis caledonium]|uniref:11615_t:CDS:1 n=1 Tax=Funneliformis caledonium TaxID=1117310 RepID=A0A9N9CXL9_9GLOM|nr:11615_t:CDS:10 [Funneliformis caledonium]
MDTLKDVPEFFETQLDESLAARTESLGSFRELGPPDLCHVTKANAKPGVKEVGSYHYVSGVDASSSATLAAYLNSLTYALEDNHAWFTKSSAWRIRSGVYCCFNAFSRVDVRVEVKIPGGVESYIVDLRGEKHDATSDIWQETYISALLRSILYSDDVNYRLAGFRKLDPIPNVEAEAHFLEAAEQLFFKGWQLGSDPEIQVATVVSNHLTAGIMKYFSENFRYERALMSLNSLLLYHKDPEVASLLAQSYIGMDEEIKAVKKLYEALKKNPMSYALLHVQADFLLSKGRTDYALKLAKQAVNCAPSEFVTWAKLTEVYIELRDYESALLTLNSCPMFTYNERDMHRMPSPAKTHLPIKQDIINAGLLDDDNGRDNEADVALLRLPAPSLRGTFAKAYSLLTSLVAKIGWDELLKCRSSVFVMEEEYRMQKAAEEERKIQNTVIDLPPSPQEQENNTDVVANANANDVNDSKDSSQSVPAITISRDSTVDGSEDTKEKKVENTHEGDRETTNGREVKDDDINEKENSNLNAVDERSLDSENMEEVNLDDEKSNSNNKTRTAPVIEFKGPKLEKPLQAANEEKNDNQSIHDEQSKDVSTKKDYSFSFNNKRLCERWLDNLFMVLYEDLRVYTVWRSEVSHYKAHHMSYRKTGTEWEILGDLAARLHHKDDAKEAYQRCLEHKFSAKAWLRLLEFYADEGDVHRALSAVVKLTVYHERWYHEIVYPTAIAHNLNKLIRSEGLSKVRYNLISMNLSPSVDKLVTRYLDFAKTFKIPGSNF